MKLFIDYRLNDNSKNKLTELLGEPIEFTDYMDNVQLEEMSKYDYSIGIGHDEPNITLLIFYTAKDSDMVPKIAKIIAKHLPNGMRKVEHHDLSKTDIICFELNSWTRYGDYPNAEPFISWMGYGIDFAFKNEKFAKKNKVCVVCHRVEMSMNFCVTAKKSWVEKNCPELLTKYMQFLRWPGQYSKNGWPVYGVFDTEFLPYCDENIGVYELDIY